MYQPETVMIGPTLQSDRRSDPMGNSIVSDGIFRQISLIST